MATATRPTTTYLVAASVDGFIATEDDDLGWLVGMESPDGSADTANPYQEFIAGVGALAMGAATYAWILDHDDGPWPYTQPTWVFTHHSHATPPGADVRFTQAPVRQVHEEMAEAAAGRGIWLVGGGELVGQFLDAGLLDEIVLSVTPVLLGAGKPLLPRRRTTPMRLVSATPSSNGTFAHLRYDLRA